MGRAIEPESPADQQRSRSDLLEDRDAIVDLAENFSRRAVELVGLGVLTRAEVQIMLGNLQRRLNQA